MSTATVGVDVGGTKILVWVVDPDDPTVPLAEDRLATPEGPDAILDAIVDAVHQVCARGAGDRTVVAVGVGMPGLVTREGMLRVAPNLPGVVDLQVRDGLAERLGVPVVVDNDANFAAWAEARVGAGVGARDLLLVTLGTGIGGGLVLRDRPHRGVHGFASEPGHMMIDPNGPRCPCGRRGCWERYASGSGLGYLGRRAALDGRAPGLTEQAGGDPSAIAAEHVVASARAGDRVALAVMEEFAWWLAAGLANVVDIFDPDLVLVGGGLAEVADLFIEATRASFGDQVLGGKARSSTRIEVATLGGSAGVIGAALLAADVATSA